MVNETLKSMQAIGRWMKVHGDSIYGTQSSPFVRLDWGRATSKTLQDGTSRLYLHVFDWPKDGKLVVPCRAGRPHASLLADGTKLRAVSADGAVTITVPAATPDKIATVVVLDH